MGYYEGDLCLTNNGNNGMFNGNGDWIWAFLLFALIGNNGWGGFGGGSRGNCATQADLSAGFANSEIMSDLNDILLGQASMQNFINQGFAGVNATVTNGFAGVNNAICTLGYQNQAGFNALGNQLASCCCDIRTELMQNRYLNEKQTCDILAGQNAQTRAILDYLTGEKIDTLNRKLAVAENEALTYKNNAYLISQIKEPCPIPAYITPNPNCCYNYGVTGFGYGNGCCTSVQ